MDRFPELKPGCNALWDAFTAGLVPVKVKSIMLREGHIFNPRPSSDHLVVVEVSRDHGPYRKGETFERWSLDVIPPAAIHRRKYSTTISFYTVSLGVQS